MRDCRIAMRVAEIFHLPTKEFFKKEKLKIKVYNSKSASASAANAIARTMVLPKMNFSKPRRV